MELRQIEGFVEVEPQPEIIAEIKRQLVDPTRPGAEIFSAFQLKKCEPRRFFFLEPAAIRPIWAPSGGSWE